MTEKQKFYGLFIIMVLLILTLGTCMMGCRAIVLHPPADHIHFVPEGIILPTVEGDITTDTPGIWISEWYFEEIFDAHIERITQ